MTEFTENELLKLSKLCRIALSDQEKTAFCNSLSRILKYMQALNEIDTEGVKPCDHILENLTMQVREDQEGNLLSREDFLLNAPSQVGGMIKVPPIIKF